MAAVKRKKGGAGVGTVTAKKPKTSKVSTTPKREFKKVKESGSALGLKEEREVREASLTSHNAAAKRKSDEAGDSAASAKKSKTSKAPTKGRLRKMKESDSTLNQEGEKKGRVRELVPQVVISNEVIPSSKEEEVKGKRQPIPKPLPKSKVAQKIVDEEVSESDDWSSDGDDGEEGSDKHKGIVSTENSSGNGWYTVITAANNLLILSIC